MYQASNKMLLDADDTFTTVVELNYLGDKGNDEEAFYKGMNKEVAYFDFDKLQDDSSIISVNREKKALAYIDEKQINQNLSSLNEYVIIEVFNVRPYDEAFYQATVNKVYFGKTMRENTYVMINGLDDLEQSLGYDFIKGNRYFIIGRLSYGQNPTPRISPGLPQGIDGFRSVVDLEEEEDF